MGSQKKGIVINPDKSVDVYFGPTAPTGHEANWVQTIPGKGWNAILRAYGPLDPWFDKTCRDEKKAVMKITHKQVHMLKFPLALVAVPGVLLTLATATAAQTFPPNLPTAIICYVPQDQSWRVGYLHRVLANGEAIYVSADGKLSTTVNAKGLVVTPTNRPSSIDCHGKTLDELRGDGRVMDFQRAR